MSTNKYGFNPLADVDPMDQMLDNSPAPREARTPRRPTQRRPKRVKWAIEVDPELRDLYRDLSVAIMLDGDLGATINGLAADALWAGLETASREHFGTDRPPPRGTQQPRGGRRPGT